MPRQSQNQSPAPSRKKALLSVAVLLALTGVLILLFKDHWAEISAALAQLSLGQVALVLALGITYPLLEGVASWLIVRSRLPGFTLRHGIDNAWMGTFGNVIHADLLPAPLRAGAWPRRGADDPAIRLP